MDASRKQRELHERAVSVARNYSKLESELLSIFQELDKTRAYLHFGATSLIGYAIDILKLSEGAASNLVTVARKSVEVPELKAAIEAGEVTISKARKIAPVLTRENQNLWIDLARTSTSRVIEKEVARVNPQFVVTEKLKYKTAERLELSFGISEQLAEKFKRVKDLLAQRKSKPISSEEAFGILVNEFIERHDPIKKAERSKVRSEKSAMATRTQNTEAERLQNEVECDLRTHSDAKHVPGRIDNFESKAESWISLGKHGEVFVNKLEMGTENESKEQASEQHTNKRHARRSTLPAVVTHAVTLRDLRQCTHVHRDGSRCPSTKWLDVHHVIPVAMGGSNELSNLKTLCASHHRMVHRH